MAAQKGLELLLKVDTDGVPTFATLGGIQTPGLVGSTETVEFTSQDDTDRFRQLLEGAGVISLAVNGDGVFKDDAPFATVNTYFLAGTIRQWQVIVPDFGTYQGLFQITSFEIGGEHNGEVRFTIGLESAGTITFTAA